MSSFCSPPPLTIPLTPGQTRASAMHPVYAAASSSSPAPSTPPWHIARPHEYTEWQADDYLDDPDGAIYSQPYSWLRQGHPIPYMHSPLPSLMAHTFWGDAPPYSPSPFPSVSKTTYLFPCGDGAVADEPEEHDLESMDIHIRETYFATSAERGRWLSSPIMSRTRSRASPPLRGQSSPVKPASPRGLRRRTWSCTADERISASSEDRNEDMRSSSPLPPSSPFSSPLSTLSFLGDDCEVDATVDAGSNSDDDHSIGRTPELSVPSTACTSPVDSLRPSTPHREPATNSTCPSMRSPFHSPGSVISCHSSPRLYPSDTVDAHAHAHDMAKFEPDTILSPLSQFELDLPETELPKFPLSDMENVCSGTTNTKAAVDAKRESFDTSLNVAKTKNARKRRGGALGDSKTRRTKKRPTIRSGSSDAKKRSGEENYTFDHAEPPSKRSKLSRHRDSGSSPDSSDQKRARALKVKRPPSHTAIKCCDPESVCARDRKASTPVQPQKPTPDPMDPTDVEFQASLTGMLVEALATSRATSMDPAALYLVLTQAHPCLVTERSKQALLMDIAMVLEAGRVRCGMFEKVDSSGEGSRHKALESRWFYIPERDEDRERATLIRAIMPRQKRNETKKYKQYYYRPLDKMSRWDAEDAP